MMTSVRMAAGAAVMGAALSMSSAAEAGLDICNETKSEISLAFGYRENEVWTSTGWWNIAPGNCATVYEADLPERYYYYYAEQVGGSATWKGDSDRDVFCATDEAFTIAGDSDCEARGYDSYRFRMIDVGRKRNASLDLTE